MEEPEKPASTASVGGSGRGRKEVSIDSNAAGEDDDAGAITGGARAVCGTVYAKYAAYASGSGEDEEDQAAELPIGLANKSGTSSSSMGSPTDQQTGSSQKRRQHLRRQRFGGMGTRKPPSILSLASDDLDDEHFHQSRPGLRSMAARNRDASKSTASSMEDPRSSWIPVPTPKTPISRMASLDFERVVNSYSIEATKRRYGMHTARTFAKEKGASQNETTALVASNDDDDDDDGKKKNQDYASTESGSMHPFINKTHEATEREKKSHIRHRNYARSATKWILTCLTGLLTGLVTTQIVSWSEILVLYRLEYISSMEETAVATAWNKALSEQENYTGTEVWNYTGAEEWKQFQLLVEENSEVNASEQELRNATTPIQEYQPSLWDDGFKRTFSHYQRLGYASIFVKSTLFNILLALTSSAMCLLLAPEAVGSGIPEMKAYLNGVRVRRFTNLKLFFVKIVGTILSVSSGLAIGPEGPLVHLGSILGASLTRTQWIEMPLRLLCGCWAPSWVEAISFHLSYFHNDEERRDLITMGAASGFAAAFGAPIGGVLFGLEEASTYFATSLLFKTLAATTIATFCMAVFRGDLSQYSVISFETDPTPDDHVFEDSIAQVPLYVVVGVVGGLLGAFFNASWKFMSKKRRAFFTMTAMGRDHKRVWKLFEVAVVSAVTSTVVFILPLLFSFACRASEAPNSDGGDGDDDGSLEESRDQILYRRFNCPEGHVNELASLLFGSRENSIKEILHHASHFDPRTLAIVGLLFYPLMILTFGVSLPSGIFMPTVLAGSALGGSAGILLREVFGPGVAPSAFGLLGAAALLAGIQRTPVSLCVILAEGTGQTKYLLPVIVTTVMARYIGDWFNAGIYEMAIELREYPYLEQDVPSIYDVLPVKEIMHGPPTVLKSTETAGKIENILLETPFQGFPVIDSQTERFIGLVRRDQLVALLECGIFAPDAPDTELEASDHSDDDDYALQRRAAFYTQNDPYGSVVSDAFVEDPPLSDEFDGHAWFVDNLRRSHERVTFGADETLPLSSSSSSSGTLSRYKKVIVALEDGKLVAFVSPSDQRRRVNVALVMNQGAYCVTETTPVSKAYQLFTKLGLRHLCVLGGDTGGQVVGMISRSNLDHHYLAHRMRKEE